MTAQFPDGGDKEAIRAWLREKRAVAGPGEKKKLTHDELMDRQYRRLLKMAGFAAESSRVEDINGRPRLDIALQGGQVVGHEAPISLLGSFFTTFQNAVTAVGQALAGTPTAKSLVPGYIRTATLLRSAAAFPSSYGVHLYGPAYAQEEIPGLLPPGRSSDAHLLEDSVNAICDIIDATHGSTSSDPLEDHLGARVASLGQRAVKHLGDLSGLLGDAEVGVKISWQPNAPGSRQSILDPRGAERLKQVSDNVEFGDTTTETFEGEVTAASIRRGTAEIELDSGEIINARVAEDVTSGLGNNVLGHRVLVEAEVTVVHYAAGRTRYLYTVTSLRLTDGS